MKPPPSPASEDPPAKPQTLAQCHEAIDTLGQQLAQLRAQVAWLQERVKLDSRNSSKQQSSDVACASRPRRSSERKRGGQPGHKGTYRTLLDEGEIDAVHECPPPQVCECGGPIEPGRAVQHAAVSCHGLAVLHMDKTSWLQVGSGTGCGQRCSRRGGLQVLPSRARYVAQALAGERPADVLVTDRYAVYDWVAPERRQVCWAHLLRDFERIAGRARAADCVSRRLLGLGRVLFRWRARDAGPAEFALQQTRVHQALERGTRSGCRRTAQTCANLLAQEVSLWTFVRHPGVEPTNNSAEQALRAWLGAGTVPSLMPVG